MLQTNNNSKPVQGQERDPPLQPRSSALRGCSACPGIQPQFNLLDRPQQCGIDPKKLTMWQGNHLWHQGVEGLAVGNGPHPICKEWHWVKDFFQAKQFMSFVLLLKKKPDDETRLYLRTWWCWLLSQPQDQIAQKEEARLAACTFEGKASVSALELMHENLTSQSYCRNGTWRGSEMAL